MGLSNDLISQFAKITKDTSKPKSESTVYGTTVEYEGSIYVRLDGSELLTPVSTTTDMKPGERVIVLIKNHSATVTGNVSSPSARTDDVKEVKNKTEELGNQISEFEIIVADKVSTSELEAERGRIDELVSDNVIIREKLTAAEADIGNLEADNVTINEKLIANEATIKDLEAKKLDAEQADIKYATVENLEATNADVYNLEATYAEFEVATANKLEAHDASIENLEAKKLGAEQAELKYANIDFSNIGEAAIKTFYAKSGVIQDVVISDGQVTGTLVGVTIKGDLIEGGTVVADKLVIKGEDGLYYKLNTNGESVSSEQTEYNSLSGTIITAKSVTAEKIAVDDLVAFDATIGGFKINDNAIYSGVKESVNNTTRGIYFGSDAQFAIGDSSQYLKYFKDTDGNYKLEIFAKSITISTSGKTVEDSIDELQNDTQTLKETTITSTVEEFYKSNSPTELTGGSWSTTQPTWTDGTYIWRRTLVTYGDGSTEYTPSATGVCITGNTGPQGPQGAQGIQGIQGEKGEQGVPGQTGESGKTSYFHIKYSSVANPTSSSQMTETPDEYIGTYVDFVEADSTNPSDYTWSQFKGSQGEQGEQGIPGTNGTDGKTSYLHIAYANSSDGSVGFSVSDSFNKLYIGQYTDFNQNDSTDYTKYSWTKIKGEQGETGPKGDSGDTGVGIESISEFYAVSSSKDTEPTTWYSTVQTMTATNKYLWNYEKINYTDGTYKTTVKRIIGVYGDSGSDGAKGDPGNGIKTIVNYYLATSLSSGVTTGTSGWTTTAQSVSSTKKYLWNYEIVTYTNNSKTTTEPCIIGTYGDKGDTGAQGPKGDKGDKGDTGAQGIQGLQGEKGEQGIQGPKGDTGASGTDGKTSYFHIKYSSVANPTSSSQMTETPSTYIGTYVDFNSADSTDPSKYTWSRFEGAQGEKGDQGIAGTNGTNGKTSYLHIAYANSSDGSSGFSVSDSSGKSYIGQYTDFNQNDSTDHTKYSWTKIKGDKGDTGASGTDGKSSYFHIKYSSVANPTSSSQMTETPSEYIGTYVDYTEADSTDPSKYTWSRFQGLQGETGEQGIPGTNGTNGKTSYLHIKYSNDGGSTFTSNNGETPGDYIGQYADFTQADSTNVSDYTWTKIKGETGDAGKGVSKSEVYYYLSTSNTTQTGGSWSTTVPDWVDGRYYWQKIKTTYTDGTTAESKPVCITGAKGSTGESGSDGRSVSSITTEFYLSTSKTTQTGGSWVTTMPEWVSGKYLWTRSKIVYSNPSGTEYTEPTCDSSWEAVNEIEVGSTQLLLYTKDMKDYGVGSNVSFDTDSEGFSIGTFSAVDTLDWNYISALPPFSFSKVRGQTVTFSLYIRSDDYESLNADSSHGLVLSFTLCTADSISRTRYRSKNYYTTSISDEWQKLTCTVTLTDSFFSGGSGIIDDSTRFYMRVYNYSVYSMQVKKFKLEFGNVSTDWSPAPEDVDGAIEAKGEELGQVITEQTESAKTAANAYTDEALKGYVDNDTFVTLEKDVNARLDVMDENVTINIETVTKQITAVNDELQEKYNVMVKYFEFGETGLIIGLTDSPYKTRVDHDRYSMTRNDVEVLWFDGDGKGHIPELTITKEFNLFGLLFDRDESKNINAEYAGDVESNLLSIVQHPQDVSVSVGETAVFNVYATGYNLSYQWQYMRSGSSTWNDSTKDEAKTKKFTITPANTSVNGQKVRCKVTDGYENVAYSDIAIITVTE